MQLMGDVVAKSQPALQVSPRPALLPCAPLSLRDRPRGWEVSTPKHIHLPVSIPRNEPENGKEWVIC